MPQVEVTFDVDANGILVKAKDKTSGEQSIHRGTFFTLKEDIERMKNDAEARGGRQEKAGGSRDQRIFQRNDLYAESLSAIKGQSSRRNQNRC